MNEELYKLRVAIIVIVIYIAIFLFFAFLKAEIAKVNDCGVPNTTLPPTQHFKNYNA